MPISTPMLVASSDTLMPTISDSARPSTRENTSRPIASVPEMHGAPRLQPLHHLHVDRLYGVIHGAASAISAMITSSTPPITSSGWRRKKDHHGWRPSVSTRDSICASVRATMSLPRPQYRIRGSSTVYSMSIARLMNT